MDDARARLMQMISDPRLASDVPGDDARRLLGEIAAMQSGLTTLQYALLPRVVGQNPGGTAAPYADDDVLTYEEAAKWLRASDSYVATLVRQGKLTAETLPATAKGKGVQRERDGRLRRIRFSDLKALPRRSDGAT